MIYTVSDYQKAFYPDKSVRTVHRIIKAGTLPASHNRLMLSGCVLVEVRPSFNYEPYIRAIRDYCRERKMSVDLQLSTECGIKNDVESIKLLNEILGY